MNKDEPCGWHKCDMTRYYHTMQEWDVHQEYAKVDRPVGQPIAYVEQSAQDQSTERVIVVPAQTTAPQTSNRDKMWQAVAVGTTIAVWAMIIVVVFR